MHGERTGRKEEEGHSMRKLEGKLSPCFPLLMPPALRHAEHLQSDSGGEDRGYPFPPTDAALPFFISAGAQGGRKGV